MLLRHPRSTRTYTLFPYTTHFRSTRSDAANRLIVCWGKENTVYSGRLYFHLIGTRPLSGRVRCPRLAQSWQYVFDHRRHHVPKRRNLMRIHRENEMISTGRHELLELGDGGVGIVTGQERLSLDLGSQKIGRAHV